MNSWQHKSNNNNRKQTTSRNNFTTNSNRNTTSSQDSNIDSSTYDKLLTYLTKIHPEYSISDFTEALCTYRQEQKTLTGIPLTRIEEDIINIIRRKYPSNEIVSNENSSENIDVNESEQSVAAILWSTFKRYRDREKSLTKIGNNEKISNEEQCPICLENLSTNKTETFLCQHTFHRICLEEWFKIERTCPLCRKILLFNDEYPDLK